ncbi:MAG: hypothetical protein JXN61_15565, partial [Sedimentisphaerales bacterium]|nr:hypothetical protein [Sedimentisphaerales bacterium]
MQWLELKSKSLPTAIAVFILVAAICAPVFAAVGDGSTGAPRIEPDVYARLQDYPAEPVYVVVRLEKPPAAKDATPAKRRQAVKEVQERVLERLPSSEFAVVHQYENIASITGYVNTAGLARLAANPQVRGVGLDVGGHGHLDVSVPF